MSESANETVVNTELEFLRRLEQRVQSIHRTLGRFDYTEHMAGVEQVLALKDAINARIISLLEGQPDLETAYVLGEESYYTCVGCQTRRAGGAL